MDKNIIDWYPNGCTPEEADKLFKEAWHRDFYERLKILGMESVAGFGTTKHETSIYVSELPIIFKNLNIKSFLDAGCADFFIMKDIDFSEIKYIGIDFIQDQIDRNRESYIDVDFRCLNILVDELPQSDMIFCRDVIIHLSNKNIFRFLKNCLKSNSKYIMLGDYFELESNQELGGVLGWRFTNLSKDPFNFPEPIIRIKEPNINPEKGCSLWLLSDLEDIINKNI